MTNNLSGSNRMKLKKKIVLFFLVLFAIASCFDVMYPKDVLINHIGTVLILIILACDVYSGLISLTAFYSLSVFCVFHIIGAHWLYSNVPYNQLFLTLFSWDVNAYFEFTRNHYDRLVHLISGVLFYPYFMDYYNRKFKMNYSSANLISFLTIQTLGMMYEILEWFATIILSPESIENYNGQQGDNWDAHKDMALALLSSIIMYTIYHFKKRVNQQIDSIQ